ncbi:hypothetical protein [Paenibacillus azoreducens]|uniref:Uncharacterized protein n=1 Tax=Paenibacillus azoreducens TaxID=116718 RepID=A0A919YDL2_9BACL|nr:hypothetical protein [Paenibacillus azoreducens]GIO48509.1 hypothetical protein J34TS1_32740 [Paenibacillus azoreducens]
MSRTEKNEMVDTATDLAKEYIKKYYNAEFVVRDYEITDRSVHSVLDLYGYVEGHEDETIVVEYNYKKKEITSATGPKWFIQSRNPKKTGN